MAADAPAVPFVPDFHVGAPPGVDVPADGSRLRAEELGVRAFDVRTGSGLLVVTAGAAPSAPWRARGSRRRRLLAARSTFGPVMRGRADFLPQRGLVGPGEVHEKITVVRAEAPAGRAGAV